MRRIPIILALATLLVGGCVSQKDHQELEQRLAACEQQKAAWEARFDRETTRWDELEASVSSALPAAMQEFHQERDRILELVPEQVQSDVEAYLEDYFTTVMRGFQLLSEDNEEIKLQLQATRTALKAVGADTRSISAAVEGALAEERQKRDEAAGQLAALSSDLAGELAGVVDRVVDFDQSRINCKGCPERLKLNRNQRETILGFHAELMSALSDLQSRAAR